MALKNYFKKRRDRHNLKELLRDERQLLLLGRIMAESIRWKSSISCLQDVEFKVFSQFGDDGIIQWLINNISVTNRTFVEFGVENYRESNTRFLLINNNWSGWVMDGSEKNILEIIESEYFVGHQLSAKAAFIDAENINNLLTSLKVDSEIGILHIDLDGNDYWIWEKIDVTKPEIVILEYNSVFGSDREITIPYDKMFQRTCAHYSNLYFGASLLALRNLSLKKGYALIGCNGAGNNAYFVRRDKLNDRVTEVSVEQAYVQSHFRESRNSEGHFTFLASNDRARAIRGLPVYNIHTGGLEPF